LTRVYLKKINKIFKKNLKNLKKFKKIKIKIQKNHEVTRAVNDLNGVSKKEPN